MYLFKQWLFFCSPPFNEQPNADLENEIGDARLAQSKLQSQVQHYQSVLYDTVSTFLYELHVCFLQFLGTSVEHSGLLMSLQLPSVRISQKVVSFVLVNKPEDC